MFSRLLSAAAAAAAMLPALAATAPLSLEQALELAAQRSQAVRAARAGASGAAEAARAAGQLPDPTLSVGIENLPVTGSDRLSTTADSMTMKRVGISQEWVSSEKRALRQAAAQAQLGRETVLEGVALAETRLQTTLAYLDAYYAGESFKLTTLTEHHIHEEAEAAKARMSSSTGSSQEVLQITAARGVAEDESADVQQLQASAMVALERWVGMRPDELNAPTLPTIPREQAYVAAHPTVIQAQRDSEVARAQASATAANRRPNWTWQAAYGQRTGFSDMVSIGVSIPLPVAPGERQDRETAAKLALVEKADASLEEAMRMAFAEYHALYSDAQRLSQRVGRYRAGVVVPAQQRTQAALAGYRRLPSLLIATVDKFAQMPWNGRTQMLFGQVDGYCPRHGFTSPCMDDAGSHPARNGMAAVRRADHGPLRPPDLIIQDELHLISGPLGTLVGLYEAAVDQLCTWTVDGKVVRPKVVASTATIRQAREQIRALFLRDVRVFPPQGLEVEDNFFSVQRAPSDKYPGRRYIGVAAFGKRLKLALIRVYVAYLAASQSMFQKYGGAVDPWMTLLGYFNSMRELGGMRRLVDDDVRSRLRDMDRRGLSRRHTPALEELTSRKNSRDIPVLLDRLEVRHDPGLPPHTKRKQGAPSTTYPLDVVLATNMVSVGVDIKRLGLMVVAGQPKGTSEYIQATSRVGRNASAPGLVCTVYNWARPRDLSHYERFAHYADRT